MKKRKFCNFSFFLGIYQSQKRYGKNLFFAFVAYPKKNGMSINSILKFRSISTVVFLKNYLLDILFSGFSRKLQKLDNLQSILCESFVINSFAPIFELHQELILENFWNILAPTFSIHFLLVQLLVYEVLNVVQAQRISPVMFTKLWGSLITHTHWEVWTTQRNIPYLVCVCVCVCERERERERDIFH